MLPSSIGRPRVSARMWAAGAAGLGSGVCAYAGLYPQFDGGSLRLILALTSAPFAAAVVAASLSARSGAGAFGRAMFLSVVLGIASTLLPAAVLTYGGRDGLGGQFVMAAFFGVIFGAPTGAVYGIPLAILAALSRRHVHAFTDDATDRSARIAGAWLGVVAVIALVGSRALTPMTISGETDSVASFAALAASLFALGVVVRTSVRVRARAAWIARVRSGLEPAFRIRPIDSRDRVHALPRLGNGESVVEWLPDGPDVAATAYRMTATGTAVAIVEDPSCLEAPVSHEPR